MYTLNIRGKLFSLARPQVMGILNATPDSFYAASRVQTEEAIARRTAQIRAEGGTMVDVGGYSTRPGAAEVTPDEERARLAFALEVVRREWPEAVVSVDTFRADVARACVEDYGADIVNDIGGGMFDPAMFSTVAALRVPYILMHIHGTPQTMHQPPRYDDCAVDVYRTLAERMAELRALGVADVILDPGFGFSKTLDDNYRLFAGLTEFGRLDAPLLVGVSRKTMVWKLFGTSPDEALNGTTVLHTLALQAGAHILRVHDVRAAVEAVEIVEKVQAAANENLEMRD
ncbi:MAG: dihydropteroate synthase [Bacteroidaceae bacterium]|nr:dihydropteroate synthase [Bacteroidaceae bacterium]